MKAYGAAWSGNKGVDAVITAAIAAGIFALVYSINSVTPLSGEDYWLSLPYAMKAAPFPAKILPVLEKINAQFWGWNCRVGEQLAILFLAFDKVYFNLVNTLAFIGVIGLIKHMSDTALPKQAADIPAWLSFCFVFAMIMAFCPFLGDVFFWAAGAANYLWSMCILLGFFAPYWRFLRVAAPVKRSGAFTAFFVLAGLLAGMTNENTVPVVIVAIAAIMIHLYATKGQSLLSPLWPALGFAALTLGYCGLIFSPSTRYRIEYFKEAMDIPEANVGLNWARLQAVSNQFFEICGPLAIAVLIALAILAALVWRKEIAKDKLYGVRWVIFFYVTAYCSILPLLLSPYVEKRSFFFLFLALVLTLLTLIRALAGSRKMQKPLVAVMLAVVLYATWNVPPIIQAYTAYDQEVAKRDQFIRQSLARGMGEVVVTEYKTSDSRIVNTRDEWLTTEGSAISGKAKYAEYYGATGIIIKPYMGNRVFPDKFEQSGQLVFNYDIIRPGQAEWTFGGWAFFRGANVENYDIFVVLRHGEGRYYVFDTKRKVRPDVAKYFSEPFYNLSGFETVVATDSLLPGEYEMWTGLQKRGQPETLLISRFSARTITIP